jgi:hypothetical protein
MIRSRGFAIMLVAAVLAGVVGCSEDDAGGSGLLEALGKVRATDSTRGYVEYGNLVATRGLREADGKRFAILGGFGMGQLRSYSKVLAEDLAYDGLAQRAAISAGSPPDWSAIIWGDYDVNAVNNKFAELGIERDGNGDTTTWTSSADGDIELRNPLVTIGGPGSLNNVRTAPGSFAFSPKRDTLSWVTNPGGDTLAEDQTMKTLAQCLGDVVAAVIARNPGAAEMLAVGVRAPSASDVTDVICVTPGTGDPAAIRDHVSGELSNGTSARTNRPWSEVLPNAKVELAGFPTAVRITATPGADKPPGRPIQMVANRDLNALLGLR